MTSFFDTRTDAALRVNWMAPFVGKTMVTTGIDILDADRNAFNSAIEASVKMGTVAWTLNADSNGNYVSMDERIDGAFTGHAGTAGWVSGSVWIENDDKVLFGQNVMDDWGLVEVVTATETPVVLKYWSYEKERFTTHWKLQ